MCIKGVQSPSNISLTLMNTFAKFRNPGTTLKKEEEKTLIGTKGWRFPKLFLVGNLFFLPLRI
jgi:hypothetical protein